jgi:hypothetical protein
LDRENKKTKSSSPGENLKTLGVMFEGAQYFLKITSEKNNPMIKLSERLNIVYGSGIWVSPLIFVNSQNHLLSIQQPLKNQKINS